MLIASGNATSIGRTCPDADVLPSEVAKRNMWFCMIEEPIGLKYRYDFAVDHIVAECDYPHSDTPFPHTQAALKALFQGVPQDEVDLITHKTAEGLFDFPLTVPTRSPRPMSYQPLRGVRVLDLGILIPAALTSGKLAALGADVVKVEQPPRGDRIRLRTTVRDRRRKPSAHGTELGQAVHRARCPRAERPRAHRPTRAAKPT